MQYLGISASLLTIAAVISGYALREGISYFMTPSEIIADPPPESDWVRLGGLVKDGSVRQDGETLEFVLTDGIADIGIRFLGLPPDLFGEGVGAIVRGRWSDGLFVADEIVARHDETYVPRELKGSLAERADQY